MPRSTVSLALLAVLACTRSPDAGPPASTPAPAGTETTAAEPGILFPAGATLRGDRASLQHYLRYVDTVTDAQVNVTYAPQTVVIGRSAAIRSLLGASWDGVVWRFDAAEPSVRRLQPGSVMLVWGLAIRRVTGVEQRGDEIVVQSEEAQLTDAVTDARITWDAPAHLLQGATAIRVPSPKDSVTFTAGAFAAPAHRSPFQFASFPLRRPADSAPAPPPLYSESFKLTIAGFGVAMAWGAAGEDALNFYAQFAWGEEAEEPVGLPGELDPVLKKGGEFDKWLRDQEKKDSAEGEAGKKKVKEIRDQTKMNQGIPRTTEEQQAQKEEEDAEDAYQKKYGKPSRTSTESKIKLPELPKVPKDFRGGAKSAALGLLNLTAVKVTAAGTVTGFRSKGNISITGGKLDQATLENPEFHLVSDIYWAIRLNTAVLSKRTHVEVPITFRVPVILGGLPFFMEIAVNAQIQPALTARHSTAKGQRHIDFHKGASVVITPGGVSGEAGDPTADAQKGPEEKMTGIGVSGLMIALQVPRIGLGFGILGSNVMGYFDVVVASGSTFTGTTGLIQCSNQKLVANLNVGVSASFLGFPLGDARKAGPSKEWNWTDPPGRKCG